MLRITCARKGLLLRPEEVQVEKQTEQLRTAGTDSTGLCVGLCRSLFRSFVWNIYFSPNPSRTRGRRGKTRRSVATGAVEAVGGIFLLL